MKKLLALMLASVMVLSVFSACGKVEQTDREDREDTEDLLFQITSHTKKLVASLDKDVTVYWLLGDQDKDPYIQCLLDQVKKASEHIKLVHKDIGADPQFLQAYPDRPEETYVNSLIVECGEKYRFLNFSGDIYTHDYADYYTTGTYTNYFDGERSVYLAIDYVTRPELPKMYCLTGHGETELSAAFSTAVKKQNIETETLSLLSVEAVPADAGMVLICNPAKDISEQELEQFRVYTGAGGNLLVLTDLLTASTTLPNLETLMADYGMSAVHGSVVDTNRNNYYEHQQILRPELNTHAITDPLINGNYIVLLSCAHGITAVENLPTALTVTKLLSTSADAYAKQGTESTLEKDDDDISGPFATAALSTRKISADKESSVIWVSSSALVDDEVDDYVSGGNMYLFLRMLDYLAVPESEKADIPRIPASPFPSDS